MNIPPWLLKLFSSLDGGDVDSFVSFLTEDVVFRFGSAEPVGGGENVRVFVAQFLGGLESISHRLEHFWEQDGRLAIEGVVTYGLKDGRRVSVPFVDVFQMRGGKIEQYLVYIDLALLRE